MAHFVLLCPANPGTLRSPERQVLLCPASLTVSPDSVPRSLSGNTRMLAGVAAELPGPESASGGTRPGLFSSSGFHLTRGFLARSENSLGRALPPTGREYELPSLQHLPPQPLRAIVPVGHMTPARLVPWPAFLVFTVILLQCPHCSSHHEKDFGWGHFSTPYRLQGMRG